MSSPGYPLQKEDYHKCQRLLETIEQDPMCEPFLKPVEWEGKLQFIKHSLFCIVLGLLDYPQIIKRPMDFDTLKNNMLSAKFGTYEEFFGDL